MIAALGDAVEAQWAKVNFEISAFAEIARRQLDQSNIMFGGAQPPLSWFISGHDLPTQHMRDFGEPPINLFSNEHFFIELLTWLSSTHAIHEHAFTGAFGLLGGKSYHATYTFESAARPTNDIATGKLQFTGYEILYPGAVRAIPPGSALIHVNMHLESPSFTIVIRTRSIPAYRPQMRYYDCGVAIDERYEPEPFRTKLALLRSMATFDQPTFWHLCASSLGAADLHVSVGILRIAARFCISERERYENLVSIANERNGEIVTALDAFARRSAWEIAALRRRFAIADPAGRLFVNLMMTARTRDILEHIATDIFPNREVDEMIAKYVPNLYPLAF